MNPTLPMELSPHLVVKKEEVEEEEEPLDMRPRIASGGGGGAGKETGRRVPEDDVIDPALRMECPPHRVVKKEEVKEEDDEPLESKPIVASGGGEGGAGQEAGGRAPEEDDVIDPALPMELPLHRVVKKEEVKEEDDEPLEKRLRIVNGGGGGAAGERTGGRAPEDDVVNPALPVDPSPHGAVKKEEVNEEDDEPLDKRPRFASGEGGGAAGEAAGSAAPAASPAAPAITKRMEKREKRRGKCIEVHEHRAAVAAATEDTLHALLQRNESFFIKSTAHRIEACNSLATLATSLPQEVLRAHIARSQLASLLIMVLETTAAVAQAATSALYQLALCMDSPAIANLVSWRIRWEGDRAQLLCPALYLVQSVVQIVGRAWPGHAVVLLTRGRHFLANSCGDPSRIHAAVNVIVFSLRTMGPSLPLNMEERRRLAQELEAIVNWSIASFDRQLAPLLMPVVWQLNAGGGVL